MCIILVAWLVLCKGISKRTADITLRVLRLILFTTLHLIYLTLTGLGAQISTPSPIVDIPLDIRTVYGKLNLNPNLIRSICCPKCFKEFPADTPLQFCDYRRSPRAKICKTPLFRLTNRGARSKQIPRCLYTTQSFESWLESLLSRPVIEKCLNQTFLKSNLHNWRPGGRMHDIYDSPAWQQHMRHFLRTPYHLAFAVYIDWFNPLGNKAAGKDHSLYIILFPMTRFS